MQSQISGIISQLSDLVIVAGCIYLAEPTPQIKMNWLPEAVKPIDESRYPDTVTPEVREFMQLPIHVQKQVLEYARNWLDANFERS
jgi:hypothetical protein